MISLSLRFILESAQESPAKRAKNNQISLSHYFPKTRFTRSKGHFVTPKGGFVMVGSEIWIFVFIFGHS
jgi:hypothetical protein